MTKRMILMLTLVALFLAALAFVKYQQVQAAISQATSFQPPPEAVTTIVTQQQSWQPTVASIGTISAVNGVIVSADLAGVVQRIGFESGQRVEAGYVLAELDTRQELAQKTAAEAGRDLAKLRFDRMASLLVEKVASQSDYDAAAAEYDQAKARVGEIQAAIDRKTIRAPFSGVLGIRQVNLGQYLKSGDPIVPLQSLDPVYVNFALPQQQLGRIKLGGAVHVTVEGVRDADSVGRIGAVDSVVDASTRNVTIQATLTNPDLSLRPGMFVEVSVVVDSAQPVIAIPASAILYAPYGDSVFVVEPMKGPDGADYRGVRQQFVKVGPARGDQVAVLGGVRAGEEIVTSGVFKLRQGVAVQVNNAVLPGNDPAPKPEDN